VPLLDVQSITELVELHRSKGNAGTLVSTHLDNPTGYGRIVRDRGELVGIVEQKDASTEEREIQEVNAGVYIFDAQKLSHALTKVTTQNAQGEKYLTDVIGLLIASGESVSAHQIHDQWLVAGINDRVQLGEVGAELNRRIVKALAC
jgi:bifunctional UDP-N-acetylglucosamine pyrophosphorylase/glucosamine-1-phosphate N-acetyltransferase